MHVASRHSPWGQCWISLVYFGLGSVVQAISLVYGPQEISIVDLFLDPRREGPMISGLSVSLLVS